MKKKNEKKERKTWREYQDSDLVPVRIGQITFASRVACKSNAAKLGISLSDYLALSAQLGAIAPELIKALRDERNVRELIIAEKE
jgi:hypothetical protein